MHVQCTCRRCGRPFVTESWRVARGRGKFCSRACRHTAEPLEQRVWRKIAYGGPGCWEWTGALDQDGYGQITLGTNAHHWAVPVPRLVWKLIHGAYPTMACHHCDNRACCRPSHLYDGTPLTNMRDMWARGRAKPTGHPGVKGEANKWARLSAPDIVTIRIRYAAGETLKGIAADYGVHFGTIWGVVQRKTWKHIG